MTAVSVLPSTLRVDTSATPALSRPQPQTDMVMQNTANEALCGSVDDPSYRVAPFDAQLYKAVMRKAAGTVAVISTSSDSAMHGMTATAVCSVCADPPTVLIVVNRSARTHSHIDRKRAFTVTLLGDQQIDVAELFASKAQTPFEGVTFTRMEDGCPVIAGGAGYLHCEVCQQVDVGTHTIFIAEVLGAGAGAADPLVYQDAAYRTLRSHVSVVA